MVSMRFAVLITLAAGLAGAQMIQVETREVPVDVIVAAKNGTPERGLTTKDFSVWEDGRPQKINSVTGASENPDTVLKHFVLYFDFSAMPVAQQTASERAAAEFVSAMASPDRYMAVESLGTGGVRVLQDFTPARAALERAVSAPLSAFQRRSNSVQLADSLIAVANSMAPAPGRKAVMLFTGGIAPGNGDYFKPVIAACNRANVALFVITGNDDGGAGFAFDMQNPHASPFAPKPGTVHLGPEAGSSHDAAASFSRLLADGTGGEALKLTASLKDRLAEIARRQDEYYRVFYTPPPSKEGLCHALRVAVNDASRGTEVRARREYCTEKQVDLVAGKIAGASLEAHAGSGGFDVTMQVPYFYAATNRAVVHLSADFVPSGMIFAKDRTGFHGQIDVVGTAVRADGTTAARFADTKNIDLASQSAADAFVKSPYHYEQQFTVAAGTCDFHLLIGTGPKAVGKADVVLKVEPWDAGKFAMGSIAFSTKMGSVDPALSVAPVLEGEGPLMAGGKVFIPSAQNRFAHSQAVYFYTEVYDPSVSPALAMEFRVIDRKTGDVKLDSGRASVTNYVRPGNPVVPFATRLPISPLPPGLYRLDVQASASATDTALRTVEFEIE